MSGKTDADDREHAAAITGAGAQYLAEQLLERSQPDEPVAWQRLADAKEDA